MRNKLPQAILLWSGVILIVVGISGVIVQEILGPPPWNVPPRSDAALTRMANQLSASPQGFGVTTSYVGLELIIVGAVLEIAGYLGSVPWRRDSNRD
jgi:hypothetical protein